VAGGSDAYATPPPADHNPPYPQYTKPPVYNQEPLKAGAVDDNLKFYDYLRYLQGYHDAPALAFDVSERYIVQVMDSNGRTAANCNVKIYADQTLLFEGKTYSNGQALFFPRATNKAVQATHFEVVVEKNGRSVTQNFSRLAYNNQNQNQDQNSGNIWTITMPGSLRAPIDPAPNLDLLFLVDSTGSMGGEIHQIQQTIDDIASQIGQLPGSPQIRFGVVTYRDRGEDYITRKFGFTSKLSEFSNFLDSIQAYAGGDYPESVNEGLHVAINNMDWNQQDAVRLVFLVGDAPPHLDYPDDYRYTDELRDAVRQGIKVYTIGASGLDKQGEYIFRQMAQITLAQYLFITRGGDEYQSGSGGPASNTGTVYQERDLGRLVVNIVRHEISNLTQ
jgi:hypothetical protein